MCDNIVFELQRVGGVSKYWSKTIACLDASDLDVVYLEGRGVMENAFRREITLTKPSHPDKGWLFLRRITQSKVRTDVFHSSYYRLSSNARANVVTIHDFMNELYPSGVRDVLLARMKERACRSAASIFVVSERTKQDLLRHYSFVDPGRVHVTYNGVGAEYFPELFDSRFTVGDLHLSPRCYFLYVGTRGLCKNFPYALRLLAEARGQGLDMPLVVVGGKSLTRGELDTIKMYELPSDSVIHIQGVSNAALRRLYSNCLAIFVPSIYEGFGLPAAEASRCGALVLAARGSALDEIVGDTEYALDLTRDSEPARVIALGLDNAKADLERSRLRTRSAMFSWEASAAKLMGVLNDI